MWGICQSQLVPSEEAAAADLPEAFTVSGLSFSSQNDILSYTFTPSTAAPGTTYQISFTDSQGHTEIFDPSCSGGVCSGTAALDPLESYQVTVTAQTGHGPEEPGRCGESDLRQKPRRLDASGRNALTLTGAYDMIPPRE